MKTSELTGDELNWAVAMCEGWNLTTARDKTGSYPWLVKAGKDIDLKKYRPSTNWMQGGPIIEREGIDVHRVNAEMWSAKLWVNNSGMTKNPAQWFKHNIQTDGPTPLIAAMRCYEAFILGDEVDVPEELKAIT